MMVCRDRGTGPVHPSIRSALSTGTFGMSRSVTTFMAFPPRVDRFRLSEIRASARHVILHTTERVEGPGNPVGSCRHCERSGAIFIALWTGTEIAAPAPGLDPRGRFAPDIKDLPRIDCSSFDQSAVFLPRKRGPRRQLGPRFRGDDEKRGAPAEPDSLNTR